jgi:hypothetical protein
LMRNPALIDPCVTYALSRHTRLCATAGQNESTHFSKVPSTLSMVEEEFLVTWLCQRSKLSAELCGHIRDYDPCGIRMLVQREIGAEGCLRLGKNCHVKETLRAAMSTLANDDPQPPLANVGLGAGVSANGKIDWFKVGPFLFEFTGKSVTAITHKRSKVKKVIDPKTYPITEEYHLLHGHSDTKARVEFGALKLVLSELFADKEGPNAMALAVDIARKFTGFVHMYATALTAKATIMQVANSSSSSTTASFKDAVKLAKKEETTKKAREALANRAITLTGRRRQSLKTSSGSAAIPP